MIYSQTNIYNLFYITSSITKKKKMLIITFGSSVGLGSKNTEQMEKPTSDNDNSGNGTVEDDEGNRHKENSIASIEARSTPKQLNLTLVVPEKSDLQELVAETNGTITGESGSKKQEEPAEEQEEPVEETAWTNLFAKNRAVENGMTLDYITPKLVNGQQVVELA